MAEFTPPEPPFEPDAPVDPPSLQVPLPEPEVGFGSPWAPADAENRDRILDWWRMWWRRVFFPWLALWIAYWHDQWARLAAYLNTWMSAVDEYITLHAVNGHSWWKTSTAIAPSGTTTVVLPYDEYRPILIGDLVSDSSPAVRWGQVTALVDNTHAVVTYVGDLRGLTGHSWWSTVTPIASSGTTAVIIDTDINRMPVIGDLVSDQSTATRYGKITAVDDVTHVTVEYIGSLQGPQGVPGVAAVGAFDFTTGALAPGGAYQGQMADQPQMVAAYQLVTSVPVWVRVYASQAYMLADALRDPLTPLNIADDHGCYMDFVSISSELSKTLTPGILFADLGVGLWLSIVNTSVSVTTPATVHFDYRIIKA